MARLSSIGAELNSVTTNVEITTLNGSGTVETSPVRSGTYSYRANPSATFEIFGYNFATAGATGWFYSRFLLRIASLPSVTTGIFSYFEIGSASDAVGIRMTTGGALQLYNFEDAAQVGSDSSALSTDTWYRIEMMADTSSGISSTDVDARINGVSFASGTVNMADQLDRIRWGAGISANTTTDLFFEDIAVNNNSGSFQNSWPGDGYIIHLRPNAAGDNNGWNKNGGGGGDSNNFNQMDEVTPDDATTNLETTGVLNTIDDYNIDATPAHLNSTATVNCVQIGYRGRAESAGNGDGVVVRVKASAAGTVEEGSNIIMNGATWKTNANAAPFNYSLTLYDLPGASATAWTKATLDTAQIGIKSDDAGAVAGEATTVWMLVDYVPGAAVTEIKTVDGLAEASVKTVDALARASVKTWNGLA